MSKKKVRRGLNPLVGVILVLLVGAGCVFGGMTFLNGAKKEFAAAEKDMPESAISDYFAKVRNRDFDGIYEDSLVIAPHMNGKQEYVETLEKIYEGVDLNNVKFYLTETVDGVDTYDLYDGDNYLAALKLMKSDDGRWLASTEFSGNNRYVIEAPTGLKISVNGIELTKKNMLEENIVAVNFQGMKNTASAPHVDKYLLENMLGEPEIAVVGDNSYGTLVDVVSGRILVGKKTEDPTLVQTFIDDAKTCAKLPAQETSLNAVAAISVTDSDWYDRIRTMQNFWFTAHAVSSFSNEKAFNIIQQSEDSMVGYVTFDYYADNGEVHRTWHPGYQISFIRQNGIWKIAGMGINSELNPAKEINY
ncbi:MAG: hypothetical protein IIZ27_07380 [Solobacterium sp.]|nr:hypothetical protein [Solobacterium sp.]